MTTTADRQATGVKRGPGRPRKAVPVPFQEPVPAAQVRQVGGVDVVEVVPVAPLGPDKPMRIVKIHLADGTMVHGCRDCPDELDFTGSRGDVMAHRNSVHGAKFGKKKPKVHEDQQQLPEVGDAVLMPRPDGTPGPGSIYEMTMGEVLALMPTIKALGDLVEKTEAERDAFEAELKGYRTHEREWRTKVEGYDELRDEVTMLRQQMRLWGNYEQVKTEMYELKSWKKKMIVRLKSLGFQLTEEEQ